MDNLIYNKFEGLAYVPYNILVSLANNSEAENFWKALKYATKDCLSKTNLTYQEKIDMIWNGEDRQENYNIFLSYLVGNSELDAKSILKIYQYDISPNSRIMSTVVYSFDFMTGDKVIMMDYNGIPCNRVEFLCAELLKLLNGQDIGAQSVIAFDRNVSSLTRASFGIGNNSTFCGMSVRLAFEYSSITDSGCNI